MNIHYTVNGITEIVITDWLQECLTEIFTCTFVICVQLINIDKVRPRWYLAMNKGSTLQSILLRMFNVQQITGELYHEPNAAELLAILL